MGDAKSERSKRTRTSKSKSTSKSGTTTTTNVTVPCITQIPKKDRTTRDANLFCPEIMTALNTRNGGIWIRKCYKCKDVADVCPLYEDCPIYVERQQKIEEAKTLNRDIIWRDVFKLNSGRRIHDFPLEKLTSELRHLATTNRKLATMLEDLAIDTKARGARQRAGTLQKLASEVKERETTLEASKDTKIITESIFFNACARSSLQWLSRHEMETFFCVGGGVDIPKRDASNKEEFGDVTGRGYIKLDAWVQFLHNARLGISEPKHGEEETDVHRGLKQPSKEILCKTNRQKEDHQGYVYRSQTASEEVDMRAEKGIDSRPPMMREGAMITTKAQMSTSSFETRNDHELEEESRGEGATGSEKEEEDSLSLSSSKEELWGQPMNRSGIRRDISSEKSEKSATEAKGTNEMEKSAIDGCNDIQKDESIGSGAADKDSHSKDEGIGSEGTETQKNAGVSDEKTELQNDAGVSGEKTESQKNAGVSDEKTEPRNDNVESGKEKHDADEIANGHNSDSDDSRETQP